MEGKFREDLYYRLSVVPLEIPPLKDYREDIPALVKHFVHQMTTSSGWNPLIFSEQAIASLQSYSWPGNVRELRNVVERILIMTSGGDSTVVSSDLIPTEINSFGTPRQRQTEKTEVMGLPLREAREIFEREYLMSQVSRFGGNISRTANFVGMERSALHRKLKSLGVQSEVRPKAADD